MDAYEFTSQDLQINLDLTHLQKFPTYKSITYSKLIFINYYKLKISNILIFMICLSNYLINVDFLFSELKKKYL